MTVTGMGDSPAQSNDPAYVAAVDALMDNLGLWQAHPSDDYTYGYTAEAGDTPGMWHTAWLWRHYDHDLEQFTGAAATIWTEELANPDPCCEAFQNWLVRVYAAEVPEPAPLALTALGVGLAGLGLRRRER